jgi:hypothetical protein
VEAEAPGVWGERRGARRMLTLATSVMFGSRSGYKQVLLRKPAGGGYLLYARQVGIPVC